MTNYQNLQNRIADELDRSDLQSQIQKAINSAIAFYEKKAFLFTVTSKTIDLQPAKETYDLPDEFLFMRGCQFVTDSGLYPLRHLQTDTKFHGFGFPSQYRVEGQQVIVSPIPHQACQLEITYQRQASALVKGEDTNFWTQEGEELIRLHAKADLLTNILRDFEEAVMIQNRETIILNQLTEDYQGQNQPRYIKPTSF